MLGGDRIVCQTGVVGNQFLVDQIELNQRDHEKHASDRAFQQRLTRIATKSDIPNQSSAEAVYLRDFVLFMMGLPTDVDGFPAPPTMAETVHAMDWAGKRVDSLKKHLNDLKASFPSNSPAEHEILVKREVEHLRKVGRPPAFTPSKDSLGENITISLDQKRACEKECQLVGLSRITFHWGVSFIRSPWNSMLGEILVKSFLAWSKTQPNLVITQPGSLKLVLERWVKGRGNQMDRLKRNKLTAEQERVVKGRQTRYMRFRREVV